MKWYSVKKYVPPDGCWLIIRMNHVDGWETYSCAKNIRIGAQDKGFWQFTPEQNDEEYNRKEYKVTHFSVIEPVEIEE